MCCFAIAFFRFLPETKGRELPRDIADIKLWYKEARNANIQAPKKAVSTPKGCVAPNAS